MRLFRSIAEVTIPAHVVAIRQGYGFGCYASWSVVFWSPHPPSHQRIDRLQSLKPPKIPVRTPQQRHAVFQADGGDAGVVELAALQLGLAGDVRQHLPVLQAAVQHLGGGGGEPGIYLGQGLLVSAGGAEDFGIGDDG
jgi:hypothetical protein